MSFEVGEVDHEVIVGQMLSYDVVFQVLLILDGNAYFPQCFFGSWREPP